MRARFVSIVAEGRWAAGVGVYLGMFLVFARYQGWL